MRGTADRAGDNPPVSISVLAADRRPVQRLADRGAPESQALLSATLLVPAFVLFYLRYWPAATGGGWTFSEVATWSLAGTLAIDAYFVAVVAMLTRDRRRRAVAVGLAMLAVPADVSCWVLFVYVLDGNVGDYGAIYMPLASVSVVLSVAAWGVARRRNSVWLVGLLPAVPIVLFAAWVPYQPWAFSAGWFVRAAVIYGSFALCCAICWGIEAARTQRGYP
jgi:hypothetical protein